MYVIPSVDENIPDEKIAAAKEAADKVLQIFVADYALLKLSDPAAYEKAKALLPAEIIARLDE